MTLNIFTGCTDSEHVYFLLVFRISDRQCREGFKKKIVLDLKSEPWGLDQDSSCNPVLTRPDPDYLLAFCSPV